jgi:hypothetical protein
MMAEEPSPSRAKKNTMEPMPKRTAKASQGAKDLEEQVAGDAASEEAGEGRGYIRLRLRVDDGDVSIRDARFVGGPLTKLNEVVTPGLNYEARIGRRRVAVGDVPDPTQWRGYPDPAGRAGLEGHHMVEQTSYDFTVRIPADKIGASSLGDLRVDLFRWRGRGPDDHIDISELGKEPKGAVERLATFRGVEREEIPSRVEENLKSALNEARQAKS